MPLDDVSPDRGAPPDRPATPAGWKWFMRISGVVAMLLFLLPAFDLAKYYAIDAGHEAIRIKSVAPDDLPGFTGVHPKNEGRKWELVESEQTVTHADPNDIPLLAAIAENDPDAGLRVAAIYTLGRELSHPSVNFMRPMESLQAKSTLADIAVADTDPAVRGSAQDALGEIASHGVVVRR